MENQQNPDEFYGWVDGVAQHNHFITPKPSIIVPILACQFSAVAGRNAVPPEMLQVSFGGFAVNQLSANKPAYSVSTPVNQVTLKFQKQCFKLAIGRGEGISRL